MHERTISSEREFLPDIIYSRAFAAMVSGIIGSRTGICGFPNASLYRLLAGVLVIYNRFYEDNPVSRLSFLRFGGGLIGFVVMFPRSIAISVEAYME